MLSNLLKPTKATNNKDKQQNSLKPTSSYKYLHLSRDSAAGKLIYSGKKATERAYKKKKKEAVPLNLSGRFSNKYSFE